MEIAIFSAHPKGEIRKEAKMILAQNLWQVDIKKTNEEVTGKMGLGWAYHMLKDFGLIETIESKYTEKGSNRETEAERKILAAVMMLMSGGEKVEDLEVLRQDKAFVGSLGWKSMISPDTLFNYLEIKRNGGKLRQINEESGLTAMKRVELEEFTYDNDATYFNSNKECAQYSYQKEKQMSALLGFIAEIGICLTMDYRPGNVSPADGILNQLRKAIQLTKEIGKKITRFRSDSAAYNKKIFRLCDKENIKYFVTVDKNSSVLTRIKEISSKAWNSLPEQAGTEYAEITNWMMDNQEGYVEMRLLVLRWENPKPDLFNQEKYCYHVIGTNDKKVKPLDWLEIHNGRMSSENLNKEVKTGFSGDYTPSHDFNKNRNYFLLCVLAYNATQILKLFYLGERAKSWTIKTIRYWFLKTCGKFVKHARKIICNIINATEETYNLFKTCLSRLVISSA